jgi:polysaccharide deacetylase 2 family uncharacterized protein YibQ
MKSAIGQDIILELPSDIKSINVKNDEGISIKGSEKENTRKIQLLANKTVELEIMMK